MYVCSTTIITAIYIIQAKTTTPCHHAIFHLVFRPVVEEKVDAHEQEQGDDEALRLLDTQRLRWYSK